MNGKRNTPLYQAKAQYMPLPGIPLPMFTIEVEKDPTPSRLDAYLTHKNIQEGLSRSVIQKMISQGWVTIIGTSNSKATVVCIPGHKLRGGEKIQWRVPEKTPSLQEPSHAILKPTILNETEDFLFNNKPIYT